MKDTKKAQIKRQVCVKDIGCAA